MRAYSKPVGLLLFFTTIALLMVPAAYTTPPTEGSGTFTTDIEDYVYTRSAGRNTIMHSWGGGGYLDGIFVGKWIHDEWMVIHPTEKATMNGVWDTPLGVTFNLPGEEPLSGKIHVRYSGTVDLTTGEFYGHFVIISGTDDLANLRGQGIMWADPISGAHYTIQYHFDPS